MLEIIGRHRPGDRVELKVNRSGKEMGFEVTLRNREGEARIVERGEEDILNVLGIELEEIDKKTARKLGIDGGVKITGLRGGKLSQQTNVREGFIITRVNGKPVSTVEEFVELVEGRKGGVMVEGVYEDYPGTYYYAFGL